MSLGKCYIHDGHLLCSRTELYSDAEGTQIYSIYASLGLGTIRPVALVRQIFTENDQFSLPRLKPVAEKQ